MIKDVWYWLIQHTVCSIAGHRCPDGVGKLSVCTRCFRYVEIHLDNGTICTNELISFGFYEQTQEARDENHLRPDRRTNVAERLFGDE